MTRHARTTERPRLWALSPMLVLLLASVGTGGCLLDTPKACTTTYTCCLERHPYETHVCNGLEGAEVATFRLTSPTSQGASVSQTAVAATAGFAAGWAIGVLLHGDDDDLDDLQDELDEFMQECAERAEQTVNRRQLMERILSSAECNEVVGRDKNGKPVTRAMELGKEKHKEAFKCIEEALGGLIPGHLLIEQRYRVDKKRWRIKPLSKEEVDRLVRAGRKKELKGTVEPDVVVHSGEPTQARFVYEFKFPCVQGSSTTWTTYLRGPYAGSTQELVYWNAFGVRPSLVIPRKGIKR